MPVWYMHRKTMNCQLKLCAPCCPHLPTAILQRSQFVTHGVQKKKQELMRILLLRYERVASVAMLWNTHRASFTQTQTNSKGVQHRQEELGLNWGTKGNHSGRRPHHLMARRRSPR